MRCGARSTSKSICSGWLLSLSSLAILSVAASQVSAASQPTLFYLDLSGKVMRIDHADANVKDAKIVVNNAGVGPDGIAIDAQAKHIYWTTMGKVKADDGSIMRSNLDGTGLTTIVPIGGTFTPKQLKIDSLHKKLYWSDREGMRVMRANLDGSQIETLIVTGSGEADRADASKWCVGIALDVERGKLYWTQKGGDNANQGTLKRANLDPPAGEDAAHRSDIEVLFSNLPEPIDIDLDLQHRMMYWTDRGDNTVSRAPMDVSSKDSNSKIDAQHRQDRKILVRGMHEAIGIALDVKRNRLYYTSLGGEVGSAKLDGSDAQLLLNNVGHLTGIAILP